VIVVIDNSTITLKKENPPFMILREVKEYLKYAF